MLVCSSAKPGHGGILPRSKLTDLIREARGLPDDFDEDVNSPPNHAAFDGTLDMMEFIGQLREHSGGKPIGFKLCVGTANCNRNADFPPIFLLKMQKEWRIAPEK